MKIAVFSPKSRFTPAQQKEISSFGEVVYNNNEGELSMEKLLSIAKGADIIAAGPEAFGGFEKAKGNLTKVMESVPGLKGVCLGTTSFGWIDLDFCRERVTCN